MGLLSKKNEKTIGGSAAVVNDALVLTFPDANEPVVWRLDLEKATNASFEIQSNDDDNFALVIKKTKRSKPDEIASFASKDDAMNALLMVSDALSGTNTKRLKSAPQKENKETQTSSLSESTSPAGIIALLATLAVIGLFYYYWEKVIPTERVFETQQTVAAPSSIAPQNQTGVPLDADQMLQGF